MPKFKLTPRVDWEGKFQGADNVRVVALAALEKEKARATAAEDEVSKLEGQLQKACLELEALQDSGAEMADTISSVVEFFTLLRMGKSPGDAAGMVQRQFDVDDRITDAFNEYVVHPVARGFTKRKKK